EWEDIWVASYKSFRGIGVEDVLTNESARPGCKGLRDVEALQRKELRNGGLSLRSGQ
ncbi:hypothetical protein HAX54_035933, partial [Datura stramonium]|nr:hypothetical protein [Datura stramonium]